MDDDRVLGWDDTVENDGPNFVLLPDGEYEFEVVQFERGHYSGGEKLPPCPQAIVQLKVRVPDGETTIRHNFFLHSKVEGLICSFFTCIGLRRRNEPFKMNWPQTIGCRGRAKIGRRTYNGREYNEVRQFLEPEGYAAPPPTTSYQPGRF